MQTQSEVQRTDAGRPFTQRFSATRRGARLARYLALQQLDAWGVPYGSEASDNAALVVAELAANAVTHGLVPGRDFELVLALQDGHLRIELSDAAGDKEHLDRFGQPVPPPVEAEAGRGLLLVAAVASTWGVKPRDAGPGKIVWAVLPVRPVLHGHVTSRTTRESQGHQKQPGRNAPHASSRWSST